VTESTPHAPAVASPFSQAIPRVLSEATLPDQAEPSISSDPPMMEGAGHGFCPYFTFRPVAMPQVFSNWSIWLFPLLPTPPRGDAGTSTSHRQDGYQGAGAPTQQEDAASQRTRPGTWLPGAGKPPLHFTTGAEMRSSTHSATELSQISAVSWFNLESLPARIPPMNESECTAVS